MKKVWKDNILSLILNTYTPQTKTLKPYCLFNPERDNHLRSRGDADRTDLIFKDPVMDESDRIEFLTFSSVVCWIFNTVLNTAVIEQL